VGERPSDHDAEKIRARGETKSNGGTLVHTQPNRPRIAVEASMAASASSTGIFFPDWASTSWMNAPRPVPLVRVGDPDDGAESRDAGVVQPREQLPLALKGARRSVSRARSSALPEQLAPLQRFEGRLGET
jgi:hypothetical protein